jgi:retinol dehydrogenase 12
MVPPIEQLTADGYDLQFGTNVVGHYLFTHEVMPALIAGAKSSPDGKARVVNTSSSASMLSSINWDALKDGPARKKKGLQMLYSQSKLVSDKSNMNSLRPV